MGAAGRTILVVSILATLAAPAAAAPRSLHIDLDPPGERDFILDKAKLIGADDAARIRAVCDKLLTDQATPIVVVTVRRMSDHTRGTSLPIERFATLLFNQWGIGWAKVGDLDWNSGILLLVSQGDRKARIELGAGWGHGADGDCRQIMEELIVPRFKQGDFSGGIVAGVEALDHMTRGLPLPRPPRPWWHHAVLIGGLALVVFTIASMARRGSNGWAWLFWGAVFGVIGSIVYSILTSSGNSGRSYGGFGGGSFGGGFSGGSFGGGSSGGGGATGSW